MAGEQNDEHSGHDKKNKKSFAKEKRADKNGKVIFQWDPLVQR